MGRWAASYLLLPPSPLGSVGLAGSGTVRREEIAEGAGVMKDGLSCKQHHAAEAESLGLLLLGYPSAFLGVYPLLRQASLLPPPHSPAVL